MKLLSKTCMYGIRAVLYLTSLEQEKSYVHIRQISEDLHLSFHFLTKILQILAAHNIVNSYRGPNGGVSLARPANEIKVMELITAIDGTNAFETCILALPGCGEDTPCPLHEYWGATRDAIKSTFANITLAELERRIAQTDLRLIPA